MKWNSRRTVQGLAALLAAVAIRKALRQSRRMKFDGKVVVITGGSRGLGLVLAREFLKEGAGVAICARDEDELRRAEGELSKHGDVLAVVCDVTNPDEVEQMAVTVRKHFGRIDVLVNNAGII